MKGFKDVRRSRCSYKSSVAYVDSGAANCHTIEDDWEGNIDSLKRDIGRVVEDCREGRNNELISAVSSTSCYFDLTQLSSSPEGINAYDVIFLVIGKTR